MTEGAIGVVLLVFIATVSAAVWHVKQANHLKASCLSAIQAGLTWAALLLLVQGRKDPLFAVAVVFAIFWSFVIAWVMGLGFRWRRSRGQA
jgi:hypothetical protein